MMEILYNIVIHILRFSSRFLALFNSKAALWVIGQKDWKPKLREATKGWDTPVWMHCASLGEFEQGRPVLEEIRKRSPAVKIILTFFSPSGYEIRKNYSGADFICYLPADTRQNASDFLEIVNPGLVFFVKYEFWNNYISLMHRSGIPLFLISAIFRPGQHFFSWYGSFFRNMLKKFTIIFVQDKRSFDLLSEAGAGRILLAGDTRFDRVVQIAGSAKKIEIIEKFRGNEKVFLAGSSWRQDEEIITRYINRYPGRMKWIFAPHEIDSQNIERLEKLINVEHVRFSGFSEAAIGARVLIMDNIGMLSSAYRYAYIAEVGGGFGKGIHNILEPACWSIPVVFGPNHEKFREAVELVNEGGAISFSTYEEFEQTVNRWLDSDSSYLSASETAVGYINKNTGATAIILAETYSKDINIHG
jgi:3-deoxy-D-manno-octulosonic-acid transferase